MFRKVEWIPSHREFLEFFSLDFTLSVFDPETNIGKDFAYWGRDKLIEALGLTELVDTRTPLLSEVMRPSKVRLCCCRPSVGPYMYTGVRLVNCLRTSFFVVRDCRTLSINFMFCRQTTSFSVVLCFYFIDMTSYFQDVFIFFEFDLNFSSPNCDMIRNIVFLCCATCVRSSVICVQNS
jgi:hypothetical protein